MEKGKGTKEREQGYLSLVGDKELLLHREKTGMTHHK